MKILVFWNLLMEVNPHCRCQICIFN